MSTLQEGQVDAVTLHLHDGADASMWHFTAALDVDHITEMARRGHASVFVHLLGHGPSDRVDGQDVCVGTYADHVEQVIQQLRGGRYRLPSGEHGPAFEKVALAGHSIGGRSPNSRRVVSRGGRRAHIDWLH